MWEKRKILERGCNVLWDRNVEDGEMLSLYILLYDGVLRSRDLSQSLTDWRLHVI